MLYFFFIQRNVKYSHYSLSVYHIHWWLLKFIFHVLFMCIWLFQPNRYGSNLVNFDISEKSLRNKLLCNDAWRLALPGHTITLQSPTSLSEPEQAYPPFWGSGLSHLRTRVLWPGPQVAEHSVQLPHWPHEPCTEIKESVDDIWFT